MSWSEAGRMATILAQDPSSWTAAQSAGWGYPASRDVLALADLIDVQYAAATGKRQKPYPRPWLAVSDGVKQRGNAAAYTPDEVREILRTFGHD